ncbi:MAG: sulfate/molybdate ABC transporter ATP-binding protein [Frankiaceae bacterium]
MSIEVRNVSKSFGSFQALRDVTVTVEDGELTALLGPSGGGKSTLLRIIAGLETPDRGRVFIDGKDMTGVPARRRGVGFVFQHYAAFSHMTVWDNVAFGLKVAKASKPEIKRRVEELLRLVHLDGLAQRYPGQLSGGQRQRMALARALAVEPKLLLLDEPFGALDMKVRQELRAWLRRLHEQVSATTIFVTHDQEEALELADQIVIVNEGRIEQEGRPAELYDAPATPFVMGFLGPMTELGGRLVRPHDLEVTRESVPGSYRAVVQRVVELGFQTRLELLLPDMRPLTVQLTRAHAQHLALEPTDEAYVRPLPPGPARRAMLEVPVVSERVPRDVSELSTG